MAAATIDLILGFRKSRKERKKETGVFGSRNVAKGWQPVFSLEILFSATRKDSRSSGRKHFTYYIPPHTRPIPMSDTFFYHT